MNSSKIIFFDGGKSGSLFLPFAVVAILCLLLSSCTSTSPTATIGEPLSLRDLLNNQIASPLDDSQTMSVYLATNRKTSGEMPICSSRFYRAELGDGLHFGNCRVGVPRNREVGSISLIGLTGNEDPQTHFRMYEHSSLEEQLFLKQIQEAPGREILLFVHGFNVPFDEAVYRAAQLQYDLKYQGTFVLFTWPAGNDEGGLSSMLINRTYKANQRNAIASIDHFKSLFQKLTGLGKEVHLVVHSMGHQIVIPALASLEESETRSIGELVLNAPDMQSDEFTKALSRLTNISRRITVYCSPIDNALAASKQLNGFKRLGQCDKIPGTDVINVSLIDAPALGIGGLGHGYYSGRAVLTDLWQLLLGIDTQKRLFIRKTEANGSENYFLRR